MSTEAEDKGTTPDQSQKEGAGKALKSFLFVGVLATVVGAFFFLASLEKPPGLPGDPTHKYTVNEKAKKASEKRIDTQCQSCHGVAGNTPADHACHKTQQCLPEHHPPKSTCIKCHRHGRR
jgi:hypothetical protein